jgi:hypothetical protein
MKQTRRNGLRPMCCPKYYRARTEARQGRGGRTPSGDGSKFGSTWAKSLTELALSTIFDTTIIKWKAFPLHGYDGLMYPPKVDDADIGRVIQDLANAGQFPSGVALRLALDKRFGSRGGVARVYRLLAAARSRIQPPQSHWDAVTLELVNAENQTLREQLREARLREERHQAHWEKQIRELRERLEALLMRVDNVTPQGPDIEALRAQVQAAETRGGQLDVLLRAFGPATGRGGAK